MATDAVQLLNTTILDHPADDLFVASFTVIQGDLPVQWLDLNGFMKTSRGESRTVVVPVQPFDHIFADKVFRGMAVVTGGNTFMRGTVPVIELFTHDMAVPAGGRIIPEIGGPACIVEGESGQADKYTGDAGNDPFLQNHLGSFSTDGDWAGSALPN